MSGALQVAKHSAPHGARSGRRPHRQLWGRQVAESDLAYQWAKQLSPVYGFNIVGVRMAMALLVRARVMSRGYGCQSRCHQSAEAGCDLPSSVGLPSHCKCTVSGVDCELVLTTLQGLV